MFTSRSRRLVNKLVMLVMLIVCLTGLAYKPSANASGQKPVSRICCSLCSGEPTDPGACKYGCNENC